jgi:hypothetical protein
MGWGWDAYPSMHIVGERFINDGRRDRMHTRTCISRKRCGMVYQ